VTNLPRPIEVHLFGLTWRGGETATTREAIQWDIITPISQGGFKVGKFSIGRTHVAVIERIGFMTQCGRTIHPHTTFARPHDPKAPPPNLCQRCASA
jgi:hypothetical protein